MADVFNSYTLKFVFTIVLTLSISYTRGASSKPFNFLLPESIWPSDNYRLFSKPISIDSFVEVFKSCDVHIMNYRGDDISATFYPIYLRKWKYAITPQWSKYDKKPMPWPIAFPAEKYRALTIKMKDQNFTDRYYFGPGWFPGKRKDFPDSKNIRLANWRCFVQTHLFPPAQSESVAYTSFMRWVFPDNRLRSPFQWLYTEEIEDERDLKSINLDQTRRLISIAFIREKDFPSAFIFWVSPFEMREKLKYHLYVYLTDIREVPFSTQTRIEILTNSRFYFVCQYCSLCYRTLFPLSLAPSYDDLMKDTHQIVHEHYNVPIFLSVYNIVQHIGATDKLDIPKIITMKQQKPKNTFIEYINAIGQERDNQSQSDWMVELELLSTVFNSSRFASNKSTICTQAKRGLKDFEHFGRQSDDFGTFEFPSVTLNSMSNLNLIRRHDVYTFISCGHPRNSEMSLWGLVSAFDISIWILLLGYISVWPLFYFLLTDRVRFSFVFVFDGIRILLEQGVDSADSKLASNKRFYFGTMMLVMVVVTNAYRGDNVKQLTQPISYVPIHTVHDLVNYNYSIYVKYLFSDTSDVSFQKSLILNFGEEIEVSSEFETLMNFYSSQMNESKFNWISKQLKPLNTPIPELEYSVNSGKYRKMFKNCSNSSNVAILGWKNYELEFIRKTVLANFPKNKVHVGKQVFFRGNDGWELSNWVDVQIMSRVKAISESGFQDVWNHIKSASKIPREHSEEFENVRIRSNISLQFVLFLLEALICFIIFGVEVRHLIFVFIALLVARIKGMRLRKVIKHLCIVTRVGDT